MVDDSEGPFVEIGGVECFRIQDVDRMEPFLTTVVSDADLWMFSSSSGSLTAGRVDARHAMFPYLPDDMLHRSSGSAGPVTALARTLDGCRRLWRPFHSEPAPGCRRSLAKSLAGDRLVFEEANAEWGIRVRATWAPSRNFGWVRTVEVINESDSEVEFELLDGLLDVMPPGVDPGVEQGSSNLVNAFKRAQIVGASRPVAVYNLESLISDRAEPSEALTAAVVWSWGFDSATVDLDGSGLRRFVRNDDAVSAPFVAGRPSAFLLRGDVSIPARDSQRWAVVIDTGLDQARLTRVLALLGDSDAPLRVEADLVAGSERLAGLLADADGHQRSGDRAADAHHRSNVLFNAMRGGVFPYGHDVPTADFTAFVRVRNRSVADRQASWFDSLQAWENVGMLRSRAEATGDDDLLRLVLEYLPLTFSRRHGDPSRPWNQFSICVADDDGQEILRYEGNWRDIFQNWEALMLSYPAYYSHVVAKFVNASTLDGYNPYRISSEGVDWEVPEPDDPWGNIGYWGDHQVVYLLRLLEGWERIDPGAAQMWLDRPVFVYADVPYRISDRPDMIRNPRSTITFVDERAAAITRREAAIGTDGRLVVDESGDLLRVGLAEKLLVPVLSKMSSFVPGAGIWMNTQRPEWNDANNALAGPGVSMVTVFHLHRYVRFLRSQLSALDTVRLSSAVASWVEELEDVCSAYDPVVDDDHVRRRMIEDLGRVADAQSRRLLAGARADLVETPASRLIGLLDRCLVHLDATMQRGQRPDGLVDSYNLLSFPDPESACIDRLGPMLEGQVAALYARESDPNAALRIIESLYASDIHRNDLDTFMLYPARTLPPFTQRNLVPAGHLAVDAAARFPSLLALDADGALRFRPCAINGAAVGARLDEEGADPADREAVLAAYEFVFRHASFTGRSGAMHGYEGIGSIYWHMVSKLLLATQEVYWAAVDAAADPAILIDLAAAYRRIRSGLGFTKTALEFGAFPVDCYSHTPAHSGAQQPGMTGQVKEGVLARLGELGLRTGAGTIRLDLGLLPDDEVFDELGTASLTFCAVPVTISRGAVDEVICVWTDGREEITAGRVLTPDAASAVFARSGEVASLHWVVAV